MSEQVQEQNRAAARSQVYGLLAQALRYPDEQLFTALREGQWQRVMAQAALRSGVEEGNLSGELRLFRGSLPKALDDLQASYTALLSGGAACLAHESDYVAKHAFQKAEVMADVAGFYAAFGLRVSGAYRELPDFVGAELEFLHVAAWQEANALAEGNLEAAERCREAQEKFLVEHVAAWTGGFRGQVEQHGACPFYSRLARLVEQYIQIQCGSAEKSSLMAEVAPRG